MSKQKEHQTIARKLTDTAAQAGTVLMAGAVTLGMLELPDHQNVRIVVPTQPSLVVATENTEQGSQLRREREEPAPHYISYNVSQRTPARSGRQ